MKKFTFTICLFLTLTSQSQDALVTYSKAFEFEDADTSKILDKAMVWCSKYFSDSKSVISVYERNTGLIGGTAVLYVPYKYPVSKRDSADSYLFNHFCYDWYIELKGNSFTFWVSKISLDDHNDLHPVTASPTPPIEIEPTRKTDPEVLWALAKDALIDRLRMVAVSLNTAVVQQNKPVKMRSQVTLAKN